MDDKYYTMKEISDMFDVARTTLYNYLDSYKQYENDAIRTRNINKEGLKLLLKDVGVIVDDDLNILERHSTRSVSDGHDVRDRNKDAVGQVELLEEKLRGKNREIKRLEDEINRLTEILDKQMEMNRNSQILLKENIEKIEAPKSFLKRLFNR